ncbi:MAG: methionine/alanine import family NSS transporter small subunit [Actinomyces urogenitalis]|uniref:methionine/alanine import family NSS transporter small subunit n=1 Tax=Actinomyces urogenitalis TaxID=103621 RepID=UPI00080BEE15|nr:methionine/alanine import family NSS transporter small subunit [Actinomyces urogenitalis]MBS6072817.1 methionine/alanine import family NSS transporter small subunit [Actinomyces urogenitalis]MDU5426716.1 methionine/alanine import family NSS transporter small subunit [Actinomyces urogenitalis]MDU5874166.1 methionine/alanine import family NSS transporter small subunit [Actinomyces urogenitalis]
MHAPAIILMLIAIVVLWGGLAVSITALLVRGQREEDEERAAAFARAHAHLCEGAPQS